MYKFALFPSEARIVERAVEKRRREFAAGRSCARNALLRLGRPPRPILQSGSGCPSWPKGIVGSISHCEGLCIAAVAKSENLLSIGIDVEVAGELPDYLVARVCTGTEKKALTLGGQWNEMEVAKLIFSAKEAFYKFYFYTQRKFLDFSQVEISVLWENSSLEVRLSPDVEVGVELAESVWAGKFVTSDNHICTLFFSRLGGAIYGKGS